MKKKLGILCFAIMMAMFWSVVPMKVEAAETEIELGKEYSGDVTGEYGKTGKSDVYKLNVKSSGKIVINISTTELMSI